MKKMFTYFSISLLFFICSGKSVFAQPGNDNFGNARKIVTDATCIATQSMLTGQTLTGATNDKTVSSTCVINNPTEVWYYFIAKTKTPTISITALGTGWGGAGNMFFQVFSLSGSTLTEIACKNAGAQLSFNPGNALLEGTKYYIRVHKNSTGVIGVNHNFNICITDDLTSSGRMNEVFSRTVLSGAGALSYPWEITYGPDDSLWITESRGYKVYKMNSSNGGKRPVLDLSSSSTWFGNPGSGGLDTLYAQNMSAWTGSIGWPQGGLAGLAIHPDFGKNLGRDYVYLDYVWRFENNATPAGKFFTNKLVRFTYNKTSGRLESPNVLDARIPGSSDHNSQRILIAPETSGGTNFLFVSAGDMGAGQFDNRFRVNNAQNPNSYEGKILRFNLVPDAAQTGNARWIPDDNPYGATNAVWSIGMRNNQGLAYDATLNLLYGTAHGPYSDDELNIITRRKNYGHPLVIGYAADGNYNGSSNYNTDTSVSAGAPYTNCGSYNPGYGVSPWCGVSAVPPVGNELNNATTINAGPNGSYVDPIFSAYASSKSLIRNTWKNNPGNAGWESEGWSGLDIYNNKIIPGWKHSLVTAGLKWGRMIRLPLDATGTKTMPSNIGGAVGNVGDTITYFQSTNRYRDLAFAPNGKDIFLVMDNSSATSGPGTDNPTEPACAGCVVKYSFLGYKDAGGVSTISDSVHVTSGTLNTCNAGTTMTIDDSNNYLWVPITGPDGNIMAEINAMGQNLGEITSSFYQKAPGAIRVKNGARYLDRNITITPAVTTFATPVKLRLYLSKQEYNALKADPQASVTDISDLRIFKNNDACSAAMSATPSVLPLTNNNANDLKQGDNGFVLQTNVSGFSSFYIASNNTVLPVTLLSFTSALQSDGSSLLVWKTEFQATVAGYDIERSVDGVNFTTLGNKASIASNTDYRYVDNTIKNQYSPVFFYRLKINDGDGSYKYSNIVTITLAISKGLITVAPNPVSEILRGNIVSPVTGNITMRIFDNAGRLVSQNTSYLVKGKNSFSQSVDQLAHGFYYVDIRGNGISIKSKFEKL